MLILRLVYESFRFALNALRVNMMRTLLSLLGVTIGIFAIIAVFTLVDSLQRNINNSLGFLGADNILLMKWPSQFGGVYPWWKYINRPAPDINDFRYLSKNLTNHDGITIYAIRSNVTAKYESSSSSGINLIGASYSFKDINELEVAEGRYFTRSEMSNGNNVVLIGQRISNELFTTGSPIGRKVKLRGRKFQVIGLMKEEGQSLFDTPSNDDNILMPYQAITKIYRVRRRNGLESRINVQALPDDEGQEKLEAELRGLMRKKRGLKPKQEDDFALNRTQAFLDFIARTFDILTLAGWIIGSFAILVGGFGIANIMFVSVRERTNIIGIQKSLGAKTYFILYQFLFESIFLSLFGGIFGISLVFLLTFIDLGALELILSFDNILLGLVVSVVIGVISGIAPALIAARLDPVIAIRS